MPKSPLKNHFDVIISGAGSIGLVTALLLAKQTNLSIAIIDPKPLAAITKIDDTRNIALMQSSLNVLKYLGLFDAFFNRSRPLEKLRIVDATNRLLRAPEVEFTAAELGLEYFALNVPMGSILNTLATQLAQHNNITCIWSQKIKTIEQNSHHLSFILDDECEMSANLLIGADGRMSFARESAGIVATTKTYPQTALGFAFKHTRDLGNVSVEFHRKNGPFTLIPMQNLENGSQTSLVWSESSSIAAEIKALPSKQLAEMIEKITNGIVGKVTEIGSIGSFPLTNTNCSTYAKNRTILVGEAAHILPPIGAQGMNLGFQDAAIAAELILNAFTSNADIGSHEVMDKYNQQRKLDIGTRGKTTDLLNVSLMSNLLPMQFARGMGLFMLQKSTLLRTNIMKKALAPLGKIPQSML